MSGRITADGIQRFTICGDIVPGVILGVAVSMSGYILYSLWLVVTAK